MFGVFKNKALETRVAVLEEEIKKALDSKKEVIEASSKVISLQEKVQKSLEEQLKVSQRMVKKLSTQNRKLIRESKTSERGVVGSGGLSNENFIPAPVQNVSPKPSRIEVIKKAATKRTPKQVKVLGEITPRSVNLGDLPKDDRAAAISDILGVEVVPLRSNSVSIKGLGQSIRVVKYRDNIQAYSLKLKEDGYVLVEDPITNKHYLTYLLLKDASKSGSYTFSQNSAKLSSIRANHTKTLQVLKDKLK